MVESKLVLDTPSCTDMSPSRASEQIKELLGYEDLDKVPTGPGRDYLTTLVLIAKGYDFGGIHFTDAREVIHNTDWNNDDEETLKKKEILATGRFERFI